MQPTPFLASNGAAIMGVILGHNSCDPPFVQATYHLRHFVGGPLINLLIGESDRPG